MNEKNLGCIDPHGMYPFPVSREVCPKCQAIRARVPVRPHHRGLPYGWWKSPDFWDILLGLVLGPTLIVVALFLLLVWFR